MVKVETYHDESILQDKALDDLISGVNLVCATDWDREGLVRHLTVNFCDLTLLTSLVSLSDKDK